MPHDVIMPALEMAQETGKVIRWLKHEGEEVARGDPLLEIETDKVTVEVESPADGRLAGIRAAEGDEVPVGETIAFVLGAGEELPGKMPTPLPHRVPVAIQTAAFPAPRERHRTPASPKARRLAAEHGIRLSEIAGSGPRGAIVAIDIESARDAARRPVPSSTVWRLMAERTAASWQTVPHFYVRREVDASRLETWRRVVREQPGNEYVTHTDLLVKLVAATLRRHPRVNSTWHEGTATPSTQINVGLAVAVDDGLVVPVVHNADQLSLSETTARRVALVTAARTGRLKPEDVDGGTFTVSNLGMFAIDSFDAIVNAPQTAILAVGSIADRIIPVDGQAAVRPTVQLSMSCDHRVIDGAHGAAFLATLASLIQEPASLLG